MGSISFSHVGFHVRDIEMMERFYTGLLGLTVTDRGPLETPLGVLPFVFTSSTPAEHHQVVLAGGRPADVSFNVINQISFRMEDFATLRMVHRRLPEFGVTTLRAVTHGNAVSLYFNDPEGNRIECFCDTPWYVDQPMVIPWDPGMSDAQLWAWLEERVKTLPGYEPVEAWRERIARRMREHAAELPAA
jgi:catechol-2,3-dioxygenase